MTRSRPVSDGQLETEEAGRERPQTWTLIAGFFALMVT